MSEASDGVTPVRRAVQRAVETGERVPILADGRVVGYVSAPNQPLPPGPCCEEHAADLRGRVAALEAALRACCEAVETEKTCRECGGVQSHTDGDEDGVVARHRDDCEFGQARRELERGRA